MKRRMVFTMLAVFMLTTFICQAVFIPSAKAAFPRKTIVWVVPYSPGGGFDTYSRAIARVMPKYLPKKVNVIIKNVTGSGGRRGTAALYRAKPDGHTIGILNIQGVVAADYFIEKSKHYDLSKFNYFGTIMSSHSGIFVPVNSPYKTLKDMQDAERVRFAISGVGSSSWISAIFIKEILKVPVHIVSGYAGSSQFILAAIKGEADGVSTGDVMTELRYMRAGELRPILCFTLAPSEHLPEVPHLGGTPYEDMPRLTPFDRIVAATPGVPKDAMRILEKAFMDTLKDKDFLAWSKAAKRPVKARGAKATAEVVHTLIRLYSDYSKKFKK